MGKGRACVETVGKHENGNGWTPSIYLDSGDKVIGLLTTPRITPVAGGFSSNVVYAYCRAISGVATEKTPQQHNQEVRANAFSYRMTVEVTPHVVIDPDNIATNAFDRYLRTSLTDVRLFIRWPLRQPLDQGVIANPPVADASRITFRTQAGGRITGSAPFYYIQPRTYQ
mgnify:FL=1